MNILEACNELWTICLLFGSLWTNTFTKNAESSSFQVSIDTSRVVANTSERFLSFGFSPFWISNNFSKFDIRCKRVSTLVRGLAPSVLRIGGTKADLLTFVRNDESTTFENKKHKWQCKTNRLETQPRIPYSVTGYEWDTLNEFAYKNGARVAFGFNALKRKDGQWDPTNAMEILYYTLNKAYAHNLDFELGNEPNAYKHQFNLTLTARHHGQDFIHLYKILRQTAPYTLFSKSAMIGPDITQPNKEHTLKYATQFLEKAGSFINKLSWHHYYVSAKDPSTSIKNFTDPKILDSLQKEIDAIKDIAGQTGYGKTKMWIGESGSASGGGVVNVSDRYVAGFMWLDELGMSAKNGLDLVVRWSLGHGSYSLLDENLKPLPDYWLSWVYKNLVGTEVFSSASSDQNRKLRVYAHCTKPSSSYTRGSLTLYAINLYTKDTTILLPKAFLQQEKHLFLMTPHGEEGLTSSHVNMNGKKMELIDDVTFPDLKPVVIAAGTNSITLPGQSFAFVVLPKANLAMCR